MSAKSNLTVAGLALFGAIVLSSASAFAQGGGGGGGGSGASASAPGVEALIIEQNEPGSTVPPKKKEAPVPGCGEEMTRVDAIVEECEK